MKKKLDSTVSSSLPPRKHVRYAFPSFLETIDPKITFKNNAEQANMNDIYGDLNRAYKEIRPSANETTQSQLLDFITKQLDKESSFNDIQLQKEADTRHIDNDKRKPTYESLGQYYFGRGQIDLPTRSSSAREFNPLISLLHEGTHALDDLKMNTYQKSSMNFLNKHLPNQAVANDPGNWYKGAQNILNNDNFKEGYPYVKVTNDFNQSYKTLTGTQQDNPTFNNIYSQLNDKNNAARNNSYLFSSLSEIPAHAIENLHNPWGVKWQSTINPSPNNQLLYQMENPNDNLGRKFLKNNIKSVYGNFQQMHNDLHEQPYRPFNEAYPQAADSFKQRLADLRNQNKYSNANEYLQHYNVKYPQQTNPSLNDID